jgi:hypothetical protein
MAKVKFFSDDVLTSIRSKHLNEYYKLLNAGDFLVNKVKEVIFSGQSPVSGFGRYQKYSKSYIDYLEGKAYFFSRGGKVIRVDNKPFKGKGSSKRNKSIQGLSKPFPNKKRSPVNLYASGDMMDSLRIKKDSVNKVILLGFTDKKAKYHDQLGASKKKVIRRLLPTRQGEKFKSNINTALKKYCKDSLYEVLKDNRLALTVKFIFSTRR